MPNMQTIYGPTITTDNLHEARIGAHDPSVYQEFANEWFKHYTLTVSVPAGWTLEGDPWVNLVGPAPGESLGYAQAAFGWNNFPGAHDRFFVTQRTPNHIECTCWAGSHPMAINLACNATHP